MAIFDRIKSVISKAASQRGLSPKPRNIFNTDDRQAIARGENIATSERELWSGEKGVNVETLYEVIKRSPEVVGILKVIVEDILADGWTFQGSKSAVEKAQKAEQKMKYFKALADALWDLLITGDAFILKSTFKADEIHRTIDAKFKNREQLFKHLNISKIKEQLTKQIIDAIPNETRSLQVLKSSTMKGQFDEFGNVKNWEQTVGEKRLIFEPEDVIHLSIYNIGGTAYGFTPLQPLLSDVGTLIFAKETAGKIFENQGVPPNIWNLPDANGEDDRNYQVLISQLKELKKQKNRLRDIITTGNVQRLDTGRGMINELQYKDLIVHFTNIILFAWGVPAHRVPFIQYKQSVFPKESNDGYFKTIAFIQRTLEPQLNELWAEFKVIKKFNRSYRIDEAREATINAIMLDRNAMTIEESRRRLGGLPDRIPKDETLPIHQKQGLFTRFNENRDERMREGDISDMEEKPGPKEMEDNKVKAFMRKALNLN